MPAQPASNPPLAGKGDAMPTDKMSPEYQRAVSDLVRREVHYCASSLVHTLAQGYGARIDTGASESRRDLESLCEQAFELSTPLPNYEEAAIQNGWIRYEPGQEAMPPLPYSPDDKWWYHKDAADGDWHDSAEEVCRAERIDADDYSREVYEHWIVSDWFARKLEQKGEKVDHDFAGLTIWARTCTGQAITLDSVVCEIYDALHAKEDA